MVYGGCCIIDVASCDSYFYFFFWHSLTHIFEILQDDIYVTRKNTPVDVSEVPLSETVDKNHIFGTLSDLEIFRGHSFRIKYDVIKKNYEGCENRQADDHLRRVGPTFGPNLVRW